MAVFGGVQVANILCSVVRTKLVALWIGPAGIGLFSIFNNAAEMIYSIASLGIRNSSVRDMAVAAESGNRERVARTIAVIRKWSWFTAVVGAVVMIAIAPLLSRYTFSDDSHTWDYVLLSSVLLLYGITNGEQAILQGSSMLKRLAHASVWGVAVGVVINIPLFYFFRERSIAISIVVYHVMMLLFTWLFRNRDYKKVEISVKEAYREGRSFAKFGIYLTVSGFVTVLFSYVFSAWLNRVSGTDEVGFYQAGFTLVSKYVGLIFSAIGMEYYPRLARISESRMRVRVFVAQEINISLLVLVPIIVVFLLLRELMISLLYTNEFQVIAPYISWAIAGTCFRAYSWCLAFVVLAKGDGKTYLVMETASAIVGFLLNVLFYDLWGLRGLGISYVVWYFGYCVITGIVYFRHYRYSLPKSAALFTLLAFVVSVSMIFMVESGYGLLSFSMAALAIIVCGICLFRSLSSRRHSHR